MPGLLRSLLLFGALPLALIALGAWLLAGPGGGMDQSLGILPVQVHATFVDAETGRPIEGVELYVAYSQEAVGDAEARDELRRWQAEQGVQVRGLRAALARSDAAGELRLLVEGTFCYRSDEPYCSRTGSDRVPPYRGVGGVWMSHPEYGERTVSGRTGIWSGPTFHRDFDAGPWRLELGTVRLTRLP